MESQATIAGRSLLVAGLALGTAVTGTLATALPAGASRLAWRELGNKLEAFRRFQEAGNGAGDASRAPGEAGVFRRIWRAEGEGYRRAEAALGRWGDLPPIVRPEERAPSPGELLPLHTGAGLSLAAHSLAAVARGDSPEEAVTRFAAAARRAAEPGWEGAVVEALGLVVRTLHPHRSTAVDRALAGRGDHLRAFFWHGVGRGLYFAPTQALPLGNPARRALEKALSEPPDADRRADAVSGLVWALTLVNLRDPEVLEGFLREATPVLPRGGGFEHGVAAAVLVWHVVAGADPVLGRFLDHRPATVAAACWRDRVREPCVRALEVVAPALRAAPRWGELFRFAPLERLGFEATAPAGRPV